MLHHVDVHVRDIAGACTLFDALAEHVGYRRVADTGEPEEPGFVGYEPCNGGRPRIGLVPDAGSQAGSMRLAFGVADRSQVDAAAAAARDAGARAIEGPCVHPEYGDYYAVFFEDSEGNKFEITVVIRAAPAN